MNTLELVCQLPHDLNKSQSKSMVQLVKESGYLQHAGTLTIETIEKYIRAHPEFLKGWITYSANKRSSSGWYLKVDELENIAVVGFYPKGEVIKFSDQFKACAKFIDLEIKEISTHAG